MAGVFSEAADSAGLDVASEIEQTGGEYEISPPQEYEPPAPDNEDFGDQGETEEAPEPRRRGGKGRSRETVPIYVVQEERERRQALEERLNQRDREWAAIQERIRVYQEQQAQAAQQLAAQQQAAYMAQQDPEPDPDADPIGHGQWLARRQQERLNNLERNLQAAQANAYNAIRQQTASQVIATIGQQVQNMQTQFAMQVPDYAEAFAHLAQTRYQELEVMGYSAQQIPQILEQERTMIITGCIERDPQGQIKWRDNPARVAYELARQRGWMGRQPAQNGNGMQRAQAMQQRVNQAQRMGGRSPAADMPLSMESLARMNEREFAGLMAENPELVDMMMGAGR